MLSVQSSGGVCGDGVLNFDEECDDGNVENGDNCSDACVNEIICGDGELEEGEDCDDGNDVDGDGCSAECVNEIICGDGELEEGEECDDGNNVDGDLCAADCTFEQVCGNGEVEGSEDCDDGNLENGDGCDALCTNETITLLRGIESNEGGFGEDASDRVIFVADGPSVIEARTSDGEGRCPGDTRIALHAVDADGENVGARIAFDDDGGTAACSLLTTEVPAGRYALTVDGYSGREIPAYTLDTRLEQDVSAGGDFNGSIANGGDDLYRLTLGENAEVRIETGDGAGGCPADTRLTLFGTDAEGNRVQLFFNDDGGVGVCSLISAELEAGTYDIIADGFGGRAIESYVLSVQSSGGVCGDGVLNFDEECDDGNVENGDNCSDACVNEIICGDGELEEGEDCDDGNDADGDGCSAECVNEIICGDGELEEGEECDDGNNVDGDLCAADCTFEQVCGNGEVEGSEDCDDGNLENGDGCDALCTNETITLLRGIESNEGGFGEDASDRVIFVADGPSVIEARTSDGEGRCPGDTRIALHAVDADGENVGARIAFDDDGGTAACSLLTTEVPAGRYALTVDGYSGREIPAYTLDTRLEQDVSAGGDFNGSIANGGDDLYRLTLGENAEIRIETGDGAGGCPADTRLTLFGTDAEGNRVQLFFNDDGGVGVCSLISAELEAGTYDIIADGFGGRAIESYVLSVTLPAPPVLGGVFFSEYLEGSGLNKAVEIYNGGADAIDLNTCEVHIFANGNAEPNARIALGDGPLNFEAGETYALCNGRADAELIEQCDQLSGSVSFNGDDAVALVCDEVIVDVIGQIGVDPGDAWEGGGISTADQTLRRDCDITSGDPDGDDAFDPSIQWTSVDRDTFINIGSHCVP